jgi:predicted Zn-ribbon and HTH transcriptional regulator
MGRKQNTSRPPAPPDRRETVRQAIISALDERELSVRDISVEAGVSEKEVFEHLRHIQKTLHKKGGSFVVNPAECRKCGFVFIKRDRLKRPGKCPVCRSEAIAGPWFTIRSTQGRA